MYGIFISLYFIFLANVAVYVFRELRLAAYRDRIAAACTVCTSCYAKYRVRTACTSLLINNMSLKSNRDYYTTVQLQVRPQNQSHDDQS